MKIIKRFTQQVPNPDHKKGQKPHKKYLSIEKIEVAENPASLVSFSSSLSEGQIEDLECRIYNLEQVVKLLLNAAAPNNREVLEYIVDCANANRGWNHDRPEYSIDEMA